jgi:polyphosphate glucokinase
MRKPVSKTTSGATPVKVLVVDIGGTHVKVRAEGQAAAEKFVSGPTMTPQQMVDGVKRIASGWAFDVMAIGYPGPVLHGKPLAEPHNLAPGWVGFDLHAAFGCRLRLTNDAAMQALGGYRGERMLFLGLGTGLGTAMVVGGVVEPMEIGHLPYRKATFEDYVGVRGLKRFGKKKWRERVEDVVDHLKAALEPSDVLIGGGNAALLKSLPPGCRGGTNDDAFYGGVRLWHGPHAATLNLTDRTG